MMLNKKKGFFRFFPGTKFLFFAAVIILLAVLFPLFNNLGQKRQIDREIKDLKEEIKSMEGKNKELADVFAYMNSPEFVANQARLYFGLKKEGEEVVVIKNEQNNQASGSVYNIPGFQKEEAKKIKDSNFKKWFYYFFK